MASADAGEFRSEPCADDFADFVAGEIIGGDHENVGAVVVAACLGEFGAVSDGGADSVETVCHDGHSDAGAADQDAFFNLAGGDRTGKDGAERVVIIFGIELGGTAVDYVEPFGGKRRRDLFFEFETTVVCGDRDAFVVFVPVGD